MKIYPIYYEDDLHTEWTFNITKTYPVDQLNQYFEPKQSIPAEPSSGYGENGTGFIPSQRMKPLINKILKEHNYNLLASDMISLHRTLPDIRPAKCRYLSYPDKLPTTSIIIIFHNESWTILLRTIWSIINRSPRELIEEIILVDDASTRDFLKRPLDSFVRFLPVSVKIVRNKRREGLIRARLFGANVAKVS